MEKVYERCCGLDVHKKTVVACLRVPGTRGQRTREVRTFGTMTPELLALADWLLEAGCTHVAMESTGVYWKPVCHILEGVCEVLLGTAHHITAGPGRKTDVTDGEWIADLLEHGLLRARVIPPPPIRELRALTRARRALIAQRATEATRVQTFLETANSTLGSVAADVLGTSGRLMLKALIAGERDGARLAELAKGPLRKKRAALAPALTGRFTPHHAFLLKQFLAPRDEPGGPHRPVRRADRGGRAPVRASPAAAASDNPGCGAADGRGDPRGDRRGQAPVPDCRTPRLLGGDVPREQRERGHAQAR